MKQLNRLAACCGAVLLLSFTAFSQDTGQKIRISQGRTLIGLYNVSGAAADGTSPAVFPVSSATPLTFESVDATPATVGNSLCSGTTNGFCGWYKAFWILGDGNYIHFPDNLTELDAPSRTVSNYRYATAGNYNPVVYLTEKYHNTKPPEEARATVNVTAAGASGTYVEMTRRFAAAPDRKIDIDFNHTPRVDYPINFVLSYRKNEPSSTVLFYYNALVSGGTYTPTELFNYKRNEPTSYQGSGYGPVNQDALTSERTTQGGGSLLDLLNSKFKSRLIYSVNDFPGPFPEAMTELRVFPVFQTKNLASMPAGLLSESPAVRLPAFAAILIGNDPVSKSDPAFNRLLQNATTLFGANLPPDLSLGANTPQYIRGIELLNEAMETSHDPNSLIVTNIRDLGNGKFRVFFELSICNKGQGVETSPSVHFNDLTSGKYGAKPVFGPLDPSVNLSWTGGTPGNAWTATLAGFQIPGVPANHDPSCRSLTFSIDTDSDGVSRLYQESPRALETCVEFSGGVGECSKNDVLKPGAFQQDGKYPPLSEQRNDGAGKCDWLLISLIGAIILLILWFFLRGRLN